MDGLTQSSEDYLEAILVISLDNKVVRIRDLAEYLKVKTPSAVSAVKSLSKKGLVRHERYGYLELTKKGKVAAKAVFKRHKILYKFLHDFLGIDPEIADKDACSIEHHVAPETMDRLIKLIEFVETCPEKHPTWLSNFYHFVRTGKRPEPCKEAKESRKKMFKANK